MMQIIHIRKKNKYEIMENLVLIFLVDTPFAISRLITVISRQQTYDLFTSCPINGC